MSLLLDALKKAAEQKAQKSKSDAPAEKVSDETLLELGAENAAPARATDRSDETEFDHSEINARLERGSNVRGAGDDTGIDVPDSTNTRVRQDRPAGDETRLDLSDRTDTHIQQSPPERAGADDTGIDIPQGDELTRVNLSDQVQTGDDQPIVFESDAETEFAAEEDAVIAEAAVTEDETGLGQLGDRDDLTGIGDQPIDEDAVSKLGDDDETDLNESGDQGDLTGIGKLPDEQIAVGVDDDDETNLEQAGRDDRPGEQEDETDLSQSVIDEDSTRAKMRAAEDDETDLGEALSESAEDADRALPGDSDPTDFKQPAAVAGQIEPADADEASAPPAGERGIFDEDLSLLLLEPDPTHPRMAADAAVADSQEPGETGRDLSAGAGDAEALELVDTTQTRIGGEQTDTQGPTLTNPSETALHADDTRTVRAGTSRDGAPGDATSTRTYAPDNYDRTLMKLPSSDASRLFAGMKSDSDVVMTPDYAKKVFRSKTSAQRMQHYRFYVVIAVVVGLSILMYGAFQYQSESEEIDTSLRPLKRDPMPGVIQTQQPEEIDLFAGSESTARTIEIIKTAETTGAAEIVETAETREPGSDTVEAIAITAPATTTPATTTGVVESAPAASGRAVAPQSQVAQADSVDTTPAPAEPQATVRPKETEQVASLTSPEAQQAPAKQPVETTGNLQIESSNQYLQSDIWLRDAYAAYSAGDDQQALRLYNKVVKADPGNRNALLARAAINMQNGDVDAAIRDYRTLLQENPKDSLAMASLLAVAGYSPLETESQLKLMIYDEPDSPFLNFALANAYGAQNRWQEAQQYYFKALQTNPQDPNYAYNLAVSLEHIAQPASAVIYYRRALDNFDNGLATFNRDIVIQRLQRLENL